MCQGGKRETLLLASVTIKHLITPNAISCWNAITPRQPLEQRRLIFDCRFANGSLCVEHDVIKSGENSGQFISISAPGARKKMTSTFRHTHGGLERAPTWHVLEQTMEVRSINLQTLCYVFTVRTPVREDNSWNMILAGCVHSRTHDQYNIHWNLKIWGLLFSTPLWAACHKQ